MFSNIALEGGHAALIQKYSLLMINSLVYSVCMYMFNYSMWCNRWKHDLCWGRKALSSKWEPRKQTNPKQHNLGSVIQVV